MIHPKSLIRRLACVPWLLAACLVVAPAAEAQLAVNPDKDRNHRNGVQYYDFLLELDQTEIVEPADDTFPEVKIKVTATRLGTDGKPKAAAAGDARVQMSLGHLVGAGKVTPDSDPLMLNPPDVPAAAADPARFGISTLMPVLVIDKGAATGMAEISFFPKPDKNKGSDAFDEGRGAKPDDGVKAAPAQAMADAAAAAKAIAMHAAAKAMAIATKMDLTASNETLADAAAAIQAAAVAIAKAAGVAKVDDKVAEAIKDAKTDVAKAKAAAMALDGEVKESHGKLDDAAEAAMDAADALAKAHGAKVEENFYDATEVAIAEAARDIVKAIEAKDVALEDIGDATETLADAVEEFNDSDEIAEAHEDLAAAVKAAADAVRKIYDKVVPDETKVSSTFLGIDRVLANAIAALPEGATDIAKDEERIRVIIALLTTPTGDLSQTTLFGDPDNDGADVPDDFVAALTAATGHIALTLTRAAEAVAAAELARYDADATDGDGPNVFDNDPATDGDASEVTVVEARAAIELQGIAAARAAIRLALYATDTADAATSTAATNEVPDGTDPDEAADEAMDAVAAAKEAVADAAVVTAAIAAAEAAADAAAATADAARANGVARRDVESVYAAQDDVEEAVADADPIKTAEIDDAEDVAAAAADAAAEAEDANALADANAKADIAADAADDDDDLRIWITGKDAQPAYFMLRDNDRAPAAITFEFDKSSVSREDGATAIKVTAKLDVGKAPEDLEFSFRDVFGMPGQDKTGVNTEGFGALSTADVIAARDVYYTEVSGFGDMTIEEGESSAEATIVIDPHNRPLPTEGTAGKTLIALGSMTALPGGITIVPGFLELTKAPRAQVASVKLISPPIREATTEVQLVEVEVTLAAKADAIGTTVSIRTEAIAGHGIRGTDYDVRVQTRNLLIQDSTTGKATLAVTTYPNNRENDPEWKFLVEAKVGDETARTTEISIVDDKGKASNIQLFANPAQIYEGDGEEVSVELTAILDGPALGADVKVPLGGANIKGTASRDADFDISAPVMEIPADAIKVTHTITITPTPDTIKDDGETIILGGMEVEVAKRKIAVGEVTITLKDGADPNAPVPPTPPAPLPPLSWPDDAVTTIAGKAGEMLEPVPLANAVLGPGNEDAKLAYSLDEDALPAGLVYTDDDTTRTISGTPEAATDGAVEVIYTVADGTQSERLTYAITIAAADPPPPPPAPAPLSFSDEAKAAAAAGISGVVNTALSVELPEAVVTDAAGDAALTYILSGNRPAGLTFNDSTRTLSGTPTSAVTAEVTYLATNGTHAATLTYTITIAAEPPPVFTVENVSADVDLIRENASHGTAITVTVTLEEAAAADTKVTLDFAGPRQGTPATRDQEFTAVWDAQMGRIVSIAKGSSSGTAKVTVTPIQNTKVGDAAFTVQATSASGSQAKSEEIVIADDDSASEAIVLSVDPDTITETDGEVSVTVTANLSGGGLADDTTVTVSIAVGESSATRDRDYNASFPASATTIEIAAGALSGETSLTITPIPDEAEDSGETIVLTAQADGLAEGSAQITLNDGEPMAEEDMDDGEEDMDDGEEDMDDGEEDMDDGEEEMMAFAFANTVADQAYTAGAAITPLVLPEAEHGEGDVEYRVFDLPAGLAFDAATRTIAGTPSAATSGAVEVTVLAQDSAGAAATLSFNVTVNPALSFGDLFGAAAGKANPASEHADFSIVVGQELTLPLPEVSGGTPPLTYNVAGLPAGLSFDPETRIVSGTPEAVTDGAVEVTYLVTDANGQTIGLPIRVAVIPPPLAAPPSLLYEVYTGAVQYHLPVQYRGLLRPGPQNPRRRGAAGHGEVG